MSTESSEKSGMSGFKPFLIILAILIGISLLLKVVISMLM
jgi:hypothetical protein